MILSGVRVVELAAWVAGPAAAGVLADWGADVVKVEPPAGDPQRGVFGAIGADEQTAVPPFEVDNRGKRSVVLDLRSERGRRRWNGCSERADVFVTNTRVAALERLGLDHRAVRRRHPRPDLRRSSPGYGLDGPDAHRPGYDVGAFWARSSLASSVVPPGHAAAADPQRPRRPRHRHDAGRRDLRRPVRPPAHRAWSPRVDEPAADRAVLGGVGPRGADALRTRWRARGHREQSKTPLVNCYAAADGSGFWLLGLEADRHWPGVAARDRSARPRRRRAVRQRPGPACCNAAELIAELDVAFAARPMDEWAARFDAHDVWWAPINTARSVLEDPQVEASGAFVDMVPRDGEAPFRAVASPVDIDEQGQRPGPVPALGEHTAEVLAELGYSAAEIASSRRVTALPSSVPATEVCSGRPAAHPRSRYRSGVDVTYGPCRERGAPPTPRVRGVAPDAPATLVLPFAFGQLGPGDLGDDVLEVGPGPGLTTDLLAHHRAGADGRRARPRRWPRPSPAGLAGSNVDVVEADATAMPFADGRFSGAVTLTMLHHVPTVELQDRVFADVLPRAAAGGAARRQRQRRQRRPRRAARRRRLQPGRPVDARPIG